MLTAGEKIGIYEVVCSLGAGGMGEVYRACDTKLQRDVALKILPETMARDAQRMAGFEREPQVLEMRFFGGLSVDETAKVLKLSLATVVRNWNPAKAWLDSTAS